MRVPLCSRHTFRLCSRLIPIATLRYPYYKPSLTDTNTADQRGYGTCPQPCGWSQAHNPDILIPFCLSLLISLCVKQCWISGNRNLLTFSWMKGDTLEVYMESWRAQCSEPNVLWCKSLGKLEPSSLLSAFLSSESSWPIASFLTDVFSTKIFFSFAQWH